MSEGRQIPESPHDLLLVETVIQICLISYPEEQSTKIKKSRNQSRLELTDILQKLVLRTRMKS